MADDGQDMDGPAITRKTAAVREAQLRAQYRPRSWADCAHALIATVDQTVDLAPSN
jgi:hypothetical protein